MEYDPHRRGFEEPPPSNGAAGDPKAELREAMRQAEALRDYAVYFLAAKIDAVKVTVRNIGIYAALGMIGLVAGAALIVTATVQLLIGVAGALAALFGTGVWLGHLIVGLLLLGGLALGAWIGISLFMKSSRNKTVKKYEDRQRQQLARHGQNVPGGSRESEAPGQ